MEINFDNLRRELATDFNDMVSFLVENTTQDSVCFDKYEFQKKIENLRQDISGILSIYSENPEKVNKLELILLESFDESWE